MSSALEASLRPAENYSDAEPSLAEPGLVPLGSRRTLTT
jgi:hypothetical protein